MNRLLTTLAIAIPLSLGMPALAQVQLDHNTAQTLTDSGSTRRRSRSRMTSATSIRYLASDADAATKKAEIMKLLEEK